jgi:ligand-binding sensor domain-containing protein/two-component sensor histidine kinase
MRIKAGVLVSILLFLFLSTTFSNEIIFSRLSVNDGLSSNFVNCIWQDKKGFIWVGTENGLQRYDGNKFVTISSRDDKLKLLPLPVDQLIADNNTDYLWVRMGNHVGRFFPENGNFDAAKLPASFDESKLWGYRLIITSKKRVMMVVPFNGIYVYNERSNTFEEFLSRETAVQIGLRSATAADRLYLCTDNGVMAIDELSGKFIDSRNDKLVNATASLKFITDLFIDRSGYHITQLDPGKSLSYFYLDRSTFKLTRYSFQPNSSDAYIEHYGWLSSGNMTWAYGLNLLNISTSNNPDFHKPPDNFHGEKQIKFSVVKQLFEDADKNVWIATDNGLYTALTIGDYINHGTIPVTESGGIGTVRELSSGELIFSSWGLGLLKMSSSNAGKISDVVIDNASQFKNVWDIAENAGGNEWVAGCGDGSVIRYNTVTRKKSISRPPFTGGSTVRQVEYAGDNYFMMGTTSGQIIRFDDQGFSELFRCEAPVISILRDKKNLFWITTAGKGVFVLDKQGKIVRTFNARTGNGKSLLSDLTREVSQINDSVYIVAGEHNLNIINFYTGEIDHITTNDFLPNNTIYTMQPDRSNRIWMSTNDGIIRYDHNKKEFRNYDEKDGLITVSDNNDLLYRSCPLQDGRLVFAGGGRYIIFHPDSIYIRHAPKDVTITDVRLFNEYLPVDSILKEDWLRLNYDQNTLTINFTTLAYGDNNKLRYYYKLEGSADSQWVLAGDSYSASFASLSPGSYTFKVGSMNSSGQVSPHETILRIYISKPFWQTWWFFIIVLGAFIAPLFYIYKQRIKRYEAVQKLREKVARDLHDDVGSTLTSINILSEMSIQKINGDDPEISDYLRRISNNSSQMMDAMDDIVWNIKPANDTMIKIIARMREYAATIFEPKEILYRFVNEELVKNISLNMDVRRSLLLIFKEALNNIVKYADARMVSIEFKLVRDMLYLTIRDDGKGFDSRSVKYGNGIENMMKRASNFNGTLQIESMENVGTKVIINIPVQKSGVY